MGLVELQYEPVSLDVNKFCLDEKQDILNTLEKSRKSQSVTEYGAMDTNVECLSCGEVEALGYFQLLDMGYDDRNAVTE